MGFSLRAQSGSAIIKAMHQRYYKAPCKAYTFSQKNTHYKADTVSGSSVWYEAVEFPDKFRIDFGVKENGNYVIFRNDSVFNYKKGVLTKVRADSSTLLLLLGGMYYRDLDDVMRRMRAAGYHTNVVSKQLWNKSEVYVIGAKEKDLVSNQLWIDKKTLRLLRIIEKMNEQETMDMRFEAHQDWCQGYVETRVSFRRNGILEQVEEYYDVKETSGFPE